MNLLPSIYTDEFQNFVTNHGDEAWTSFFKNLSSEVDSKFLELAEPMDKDQLYIFNKQREALQTLLTSLTTNYED